MVGSPGTEEEHFLLLWVIIAARHMIVIQLCEENLTAMTGLSSKTLQMR